MEPPDAWPVGADEFKRRSGSHDRWRSIIAAIGYAPFLLIYLLVHTKYLRPYVPESKQAAVGVLILLPGAWFAVVMVLLSALGPKLARLTCPHCGAALTGAARQHVLEEGSCSRCGTRLVAQSAAGSESSTD